MYPHVLTNKCLSIMIGGRPFIILHTHPNFRLAVQALKAGDSETLKAMVDIPSAIHNYTEGACQIVDGEVMYNDLPLHNYLTERLLGLMNEGFNVQPLIRFLENLMENPSRTAVEELYMFLEAGQMPITDDGCFLAYKRVRNDFTDHYSQTFDNSVGKTCEMPRNQVDEDRNTTCSTGLHFCSQSYLKLYFSGPTNRTVILKINPKDVVCIPKDYNNAKGRCCKYEVISEHTGGDKASAFNSNVVGADGGESNETSKPKSTSDEKATEKAKTRKDEAIEIITEIVNDITEELELDTITTETAQRILEDSRTKVVESLAKKMKIAKKTGGEYFRKLKAQIATSLSDDESNK